MNLAETSRLSDSQRTAVHFLVLGTTRERNPMNRRKAAVIGAAIVLGGLSIACGGTSDGSANGTTKDQPITASSPVANGAANPATTPAGDPNSISGDGTFAIPSQVKPGTYRTVVPNDSLNCYYARLKDASGSFEGIITNENGRPGSQQIVEIKTTDKFFKTEGCGTWSKVG